MARTRTLEMGPFLVEIATTLPMSGNIWRVFGQMRSASHEIRTISCQNSAEVGTTLVDQGPRLAELGQFGRNRSESLFCWSNPGQRRPKSAQVGPRSAKLPKTWSSSGHSSADLGRVGPEFGFDRLWAIATDAGSIRERIDRHPQALHGFRNGMSLFANHRSVCVLACRWESSMTQYTARPDHTWRCDAIQGTTTKFNATQQSYLS